MNPRLSAELHQQGLLTNKEAMWYYDFNFFEQGVIEDV